MAKNKTELNVINHLSLDTRIIDYIKSEVEYIFSKHIDSFKHIDVYIDNDYQYVIDEHNNPIVCDLKIEVEGSNSNNTNQVQRITIYASMERIQKQISNLKI